MKNLIFAAVIILFAFTTNSEANTNHIKHGGGYFYTSLAPHGSWIEIGFGTTAWKPAHTKRNWQPYHDGRWIYTDYGWYWDSYESFGDIVYHYGRWFYDDYYGWLWIPDYEWAPAWVEWRYDDHYIGWAPLSPYAIFSIEIGIHFTYNYYVPYNHWNYVKYNHFCDDNLYSYYVPSKYKYRVHSRTHERTNYAYRDGRVRNDGIEIEKIRERSGRTIERRELVSVNDPTELTRDRSSKNRDKEIKTYIASKDDISRDELRNVKIERSDRKSSLDLTKVELGRERNIKQTNERKIERNTSEAVNIIARDVEKVNSRNGNDKTPEVRNVEKKDLSRERSIEEKKKQERVETENRNADIERKKEIEKNNARIESQRRETEQQKIKDAERKSNTEINKQNNERKVETRQQNNTNSDRNVEVKKNERTETKSDSRSTEENSRTRSR